jgi:hypothetical protein
MRKLCLYIFCAFLIFSGSFLLAQGRGRGKYHKRDVAIQFTYSDHDRDLMSDWYHHHESNLPPGLAKRDRLPPGLEKQLVARGTLPPGLRKKVLPCPPDLERQLPPAPPGYAHTVISGHIVLMNQKTFAILDIFHVEP